MTERLNKLYEYFMNQDSNRFISSKTLINEIEDYGWMKENNAISAVQSDIVELQREYAFGNLDQCVVGLNSTGYKIGTQEDIQKLIGRRWKRVVKSMKLTRAIAEKAGLDGQMNMYGEEEITTKREEKDNEQ